METKSTKDSLEKTQTSLFLAAVESAIEDLPRRSQEIVISRYGIDGKGALTLEEIGKKYSITRERVRQVIREVFKKVKDRKEMPILGEAREKISFTIAQNSGIMEQQSLLETLAKNDTKQQGAAAFLLDCLGDVVELEVKGEIKRSYVAQDFQIEQWRAAVGAIIAVFEDQKQPLTEAELFEKVSEKIKQQVSEKQFVDFMAAAEQLKKNNFGKWGLTQWREISPKGTREKAYLVLKESDKPLHFKEIAQQIDAHNLNKRKTHPQTVHNELIKDKKFVLVGRGIYALAEWGYKKGTVKDVLEEILKASGKPMTRDEILKKVLEIRQVKKSTIIINLNNFFQKQGEGRYTLKK